MALNRRCQYINVFCLKSKVINIFIKSKGLSTKYKINRNLRGVATAIRCNRALIGGQNYVRALKMASVAGALSSTALLALHRRLPYILQ